MRSIVFASLVALAFAATPAFERSFEPKNEYHYKFDGLILSGLPTASSELSQTRISTRARVQAIDDRYIHLQLIKIRMAASHLPETEQMTALNALEQRELSEEHRQLLELPVRAQLRNGLISEIQFEKEDAEWSKNLKRSVLNMISFNPVKPTSEEYENKYEDKSSDEENQSFFTNEKTIEGDCQVAYTIVRENNKRTVITKSINFDKCIMRPETVQGLRYSTECPECEKEGQSLKPQTVYTYTVENNLLKEVEVRSVYSLNVNGQEVMKTETRSKLTHEETHKINNSIKKVNGEKEEIVYSSRWEQLVEDFYKNGDKAEIMPFEQFPLEKMMQLIKTITEQVQEFENNMPETTHQLARLVQILRLASAERLEKIHNTIYKKADKKIQSLIEHALAIAGTKTTVQHLIHHIEKNEIEPVEVAQLLKSIQETPFPSERIAELLIELARSHVAKNNEIIRQSAWLAAGSVVRGVVSKTAEHSLIRENKRELKQKFVRVFLQQFREAETTYEKILALKTLGNAGIDLAVYDLNEIIVDNRQTLQIRKEAIDALRLLKDVMPRKIQKVLLPIYKNRQFAPELRMAALWRLMHTQPEEPVLIQVVSQMEKESNQQVAAFTYQLIQYFAKSTNPCYQRVANDASKVLSFTHFQPQSQVLSTYAQLPIFSQDIASGAQFDFAAIFEKNSFLPKELHASLDSVLGGNWNKYLVQVGFSQQNMETYILKALEKLEVLAKEPTSVVRGRRAQSGIKMLKELAQKMNIRARAQFNNEKDAHAMLFFRYKNMDYAVLSADNKMIENIVEKYIDDGKIDIPAIRNLLNNEKAQEFEQHHAAYFYETIRQIPSTIGLPITVSGKIPTIFSAEGQVNFELRNLEASFSLEVRPSVAATHVYEMRMFTPLFEQGVKTLQSVRAFTPVKFELTAALKQQLEITYKVIVPENQKSIVALASRPVVFLRYPGIAKFDYIEAEERTVVVPQWQQKTQEIEKNYKVLGLEVAARGNILNQWTLENSVLAEQDVEYTIENKNRPAEFTARLNINMLEKADLTQINFDNVFETQFENEESKTEERRNHFNKMVSRIQKEQGYKHRMTLKLEAPRDNFLNTEYVTVCDKDARICKFNIDVRRSPIQEETKEWTLRTEIVAARPEMPSSLRQLREQPHREVQLSINSKWGANKKNEINCNVQLQQSKEQKKYERSLSNSFNGMPEYELLIKAARLNQVDAVAQYKLSPETEYTFSRFFDLVKAYNFWSVSTKQENNKDNLVALRLVVEPATRQYINMTLQTPEQSVELRNTRIPRVHLPSIAQRSMRYQVNEKTNSVCKVEQNEVRTFDNLIYSAPITTCYSLFAKDCSEEPTFAVLVKKIRKNSEELIVKIVRREEEIVLQKSDDEILVKIDGKRIPTEQLEEYEIELHGNSYVVVRLPQGEVRFDGYTLKTQMPSIMLKNQLCGLCGNNDDEMTNEFRTSDDSETDNIQEFHRSYLLKNEECEAEEERLSEKKNYKKYEREDREENDSDSYETENDVEYRNYNKKNQNSEKNQMVEKTQIKEFSHRVCFSLEPVVECRRGYEASKTVEKKVKFTCLPRHNNEARRFLKEARQQVLELSDYTVSYVHPVDVPTACVAY